MSLSSLASSRSLRSDLMRLCSDGVECDADLRQLTRWRIGGTADFVVRPSMPREVTEVLRFLAARDVPFLVIGHCSNLLFADDGVRAVILQIGSRMSRMAIGGTSVFAQAGIWVPRFAYRLGKAGLTGAEHTIGIPGTLGGLVCMNGGSNRRGIGENLLRVICTTREGNLYVLEQAECGFAYRQSVMQRSGDVILEGIFRFRAGDPKTISQEMRATLRERRLKFPLKQPNCGSVFVSNPATYAAHGPPGAIIERCGLKGYRIGDAQISPRHANFIVNLGNATASDTLRLIHHIRRTALERSGCHLECEVRHVASNGQVTPAHLTVPSF